MFVQPLQPVRNLCLTWRPTRVEDLESCLSLAKEDFLHDAASRRSLLGLLGHLVSSRSCISVTIEDRGQPLGRRIVGFGLSLFLSKWVSKMLLENPKPFQSKWIPVDWAAGRKPFLASREIATGNREGNLSLAVLHYGWDERRYSPQEQSRIAQLLPESFVETHRGYRLQESWTEVYGEDQRDLLISSGYEPSMEFLGYPPPKRPYLMRCTSDTCRVGTIMASVLTRDAAQPRFGLKPQEQELLQQAFAGRTEGDIARALEISPNTVKKRWQGVYQKVESVDRELLWPPGMVEKERLRQRRRILLDYLRSHPEELRPF